MIHTHVNLIGYCGMCLWQNSLVLNMIEWAFGWFSAVHGLANLEPNAGVKGSQSQYEENTSILYRFSVWREHIYIVEVLFVNRTRLYCAGSRWE